MDALLTSPHARRYPRRRRGGVRPRSSARKDSPMRRARFLSACLLAACLLPWAGSALRAGSDVEARIEYLDELVVILEETKSPDAFMVPLRCLDDDKADPRMLIPLAIRNAERLGILG